MRDRSPFKNQFLDRAREEKGRTVYPNQRLFEKVVKGYGVWSVCCERGWECELVKEWIIGDLRLSSNDMDQLKDMKTKRVGIRGNNYSVGCMTPSQ